MTKLEFELKKLHINEQERTIMIRHAETLLETLRHKLGLTGTKAACNNGDCGACTVLVNDNPIYSCHMLSSELTDEKITTIEGLGDHFFGEIFAKNWALQCGYCTPGFILNCYALAKQTENTNDVVINEWLDANICRCTGYEEIKSAAHEIIRANYFH